jgi:hypothetical protein
VCGDISFETDDEICNAELIFKSNASIPFKNLTRSCLRIRPRDRIKIGNIFHYPWMVEDYLVPLKIPMKKMGILTE